MKRCKRVSFLLVNVHAPPHTGSNDTCCTFMANQAAAYDRYPEL
jgi:hypothetical protein